MTRAAVGEPAIFEVTRRLVLPDGSTAMPGDRIDCSGWRLPALRANVEIRRLLPLNEEAAHLANPTRERIDQDREAAAQ